MRIEPKGNDRSINRKTFNLMNKMVRKFEYDNRDLIHEKIMEQLMYGVTFLDPEDIKVKKVGVSINKSI